MKKLLLILLMVILLSISINALNFECNQTIFSDNFDYSDSVLNHNWVSFDDCCGAGEIPIDSGGIFGGTSWGFNAISTFSSVRSLATEIENISRRAILSFNVSLVNESDSPNIDYALFLRTKPLIADASWQSNGIKFSVNHEGKGNFSATIYDFASENCSYPLADIPFNTTFDIELDFSLNTYTVFQDGIAQPLCENKVLGLPHFTGFKIEDQHKDSEYMRNYLDDLKICTAETIHLSCDFPTVFCDNFNYDTPLINNEWVVRNNDRSINQSFSPSNNELTLREDNKFLGVEHTTGTFPTNYRISETRRIVRSKFSPMFSVEFVLNFGNSSNNVLEYEGSSEANKGGYVIRVEINNSGANATGDMNWQYLDSNLNYIDLCKSCTQSNTELNVKINTYFTHRDIFPFNASFQADEVEVFVNNVKLGNFFGFITDTDYLGYYIFTKFPNGNYTIDDYFVMVGLDKEVDLSVLGYLDIFSNRTAEEDVFGGTGDFAEAVSTIWDDFGLISTTSKVMVGIMLMFLLAVFLLGVGWSAGFQIPVGAILLIEVFFMIVLTYMKLLPLWLPFVMVLFGVGLFALAVKSGTAG